MSGLRLLAPITDGQRDALRATLLRAGRLPVYGEAFAHAGVDEEQILADPLGSLERLPVFAPAMQASLARQALAQRRHDLGGVELSSGTGGPPKRRILSEEDVALDAALLTRLLHLAGIRPEDRVVAMELAVTPLAAAFLEGCERLGVRESTAIAWRPGADPAPLRRLTPSVLIAPPSLLERLEEPPPGLRLVVYNGDRLSGEAEARLRAAGVGVCSLYGLTETSALGIGCAESSGVHLAPEQALFELRPLAADDELIITTLGFSMPLLRYPSGDRVRPLSRRCACGSSWPKVEVLGRLGTRFSLFEVETSVDELQAFLFGDEQAPLQIVLDDAPHGSVQMTLRVPVAGDRWPVVGDRSRSEPPTTGHRSPITRRMRRRLRAHPLLGYLIEAGLVRVRFRVQQPAGGRKLTPLIDRRRGGAGSDAG